MTNKEANITNLKVGDKVVLNKECSEHIEECYINEFVKFFEQVVYGKITYIKMYGMVDVNWINHKGIMVYEDWSIKKEHLIPYEGSN